MVGCGNFQGGQSQLHQCLAYQQQKQEGAKGGCSQKDP